MKFFEYAEPTSLQETAELLQSCAGTASLMAGGTDLLVMMKEHVRSGNTVLFSTHVLAVAEQLCDRIGILKEGKLIFVGSLEELKANHPDKDLETIYLELARRKVEEG